MQVGLMVMVMVMMMMVMMMMMMMMVMMLGPQQQPAGVHDRPGEAEEDAGMAGGHQQ